MNHSLIYQNIVAIVVLMMYSLIPEVIDSTRYVLFGLVILFIGIPHGAMDHVIDGAIEKWNPNSLNFRFYGWYLGAILGYSVLWYFYPGFSFLLFFLMTAYHFGQSDVYRLKISEEATAVLIPLRGLYLILLILFGDLQFSSEVIGTVTNFNIIEWVLPYQVAIDFLVISVILIYLLLLLIYNIKAKKGLKESALNMSEVLMLYLLFFYVDSLVAFAIYFGFWHSYEHVKVMAGFLKSKTGENLTVKSFYEKALSFSLIIYLLMLFMYNILDAFGEANLMIAILLIAISVLTLPHMIVVEKLYKKT